VLWCGGSWGQKGYGLDRVALRGAMGENMRPFADALIVAWRGKDVSDCS
jgi:hypothetical protein